MCFFLEITCCFWKWLYYFWKFLLFVLDFTFSFWSSPSSTWQGNFQGEKVKSKKQKLKKTKQQTTKTKQPDNKKLFKTVWKWCFPFRELLVRSGKYFRLSGNYVFSFWTVLCLFDLYPHPPGNEISKKNK